MTLRDLVSLVVTLSKYLPLDAIVALAKAMAPFPTWTDSASVSAWLGKLTISGPAAAVILGFVPSGSAPVVAAVDYDVDEERIQQMVEAELSRTSGNETEAIDPALIAAIAQAIMAIIAYWKKS